jgi:NitT/TauT family transport system substrate-binding protein
MAKKIDAACTWNYPLTQIKHQLGSNGEMFFDKEIYTEVFNIVAQQDYVQKNPGTVKRFLRALIKAENFVATHPDEAQSIMSTDTPISRPVVKCKIKPSQSGCATTKHKAMLHCFMQT